MPVITTIKPQRNKKRVNIYLDSKYGFGIDLETFVKLGLKVEQELGEDEVEKIVKKAEFQKSLDKLLRYATLRPRSGREVNDWFRKRKVHESLHKKLTSKLKTLDLLEDEKFARWWVDQRLSFRPRGKRALESELIGKGIDRTIIKTVLSETDVDEVGIATELIKKKKYKWDKLPLIEAREKKSAFLARKGFGWDVVKKAIDN